MPADAKLPADLPVLSGITVPSEAGSSRAINEAAFVLDEAGIPNARQEAGFILEHVLGGSPLSGQRLSASQWREFFSLVGRRAQRIPLQHVLGVMYFRQLSLRARPGVFVVRPETEWVAQAAIEAARYWVGCGVSPRVLDLGCGSGALGISIASELPQSNLTSVDISPEAVALTRENAQLAGVPLRSLIADAREATLLAGESFHIIASNPPYVAQTVTQPEASADPPTALYGGGVDGLEIPLAFLDTATRLLVEGGTLVMEHSETQGEALCQAAAQRGFSLTRTGSDLGGRPRFLVARL